MDTSNKLWQASVSADKGETFRPVYVVAATYTSAYVEATMVLKPGEVIASLSESNAFTPTCGSCARNRSSSHHCACCKDLSNWRMK